MNSDKVVFVKRETLLNWLDVAAGDGRKDATDLEIFISDIINTLDANGTVYVMDDEDYRDG